MAPAHPAAAAPALADAANLFPEALGESLHNFARLIQPHLARLDNCFLRALKSPRASHTFDVLQRKALRQITSGAASRLLSAGRPLADYFEQTAYNSRRLAKLNTAPAEVVAALREYDRQVDTLLANRYPREAPALAAAREQLHFGAVLTIHDAFYQVREAETQAFYGLLRAEVDATGLDDLRARPR